MLDNNNPVQQALGKRNQLDSQAFTKLRELMKMINYDPGRKKLVQIISEYNGYDEDENEEFLKEIEGILEARDEANEEFLKEIINAQRQLSQQNKEA